MDNDPHQPQPRKTHHMRTDPPRAIDGDPRQMAPQGLPEQAPNRLANGLVKARILETAEILFAEVGFDAASFRDITNRAGVAVSAIYYHFGSKLGILREVFMVHARRLTEQRASLLHRVPRDAQGRPILEAVLEAFLRPSFLPLDFESNDLFNKMRARLAIETAEVMRTILKEAFDANDQAFLAALMLALPEIPAQAVYWRFHMLVGAKIYTMADPGQLEGLSNHSCSSKDSATALQQMIDAFSAAFRAPQRDETTSYF
jgi:AcrR family transcriptional regulator